MFFFQFQAKLEILKISQSFKLMLPPQIEQEKIQKYMNMLLYAQ